MVEWGTNVMKAHDTLHGNIFMKPITGTMNICQ